MTGRGNVSRFQLKGQSRAGIGGPRYLPGSAPHRLTHLGLACPARHAGGGAGLAKWQQKTVALSSGIQLRGGCREPWRSPPRPRLRLAPGLWAQE